MYVLKLKDVDCRNCIPQINTVLTDLDNEAEVGVDLLNSEVRVQTSLPIDKVEKALNREGFTVVSAQNRNS